MSLFRDSSMGSDELQRANRAKIRLDVHSIPNASLQADLLKRGDLNAILVYLRETITLRFSVLRR